MGDGCCRNLQWLPISVVILVPLTFITAFLIAVCLGHVEPDFPYISDTGALPPESCIFGQFLNISAVLIGLTFYVKYKQVEEHFRHDMSGGFHKLNKTALIMGLLSALGISIVGNFQETYTFEVHIFGAFLAFGFGILYCWIHTHLSFKLQPHLNKKSIAYIRLVISIVSAVAFVMTFALDFYARCLFHGHTKRKWLPKDGGYTYHVISTASEWVMALMFIAFYLTFIPEFRKITMAPIQVTFIIENTETNSGIFRAEEEVIS